MTELLKKLTNEEKAVLEKINIVSSDMAEIEEQIADYLQLHCLTDNDLTEEGLICENILNKIGSLD